MHVTRMPECVSSSQVGRRQDDGSVHEKAGRWIVVGIQGEGFFSSPIATVSPQQATLCIPPQMYDSIAIFQLLAPAMLWTARRCCTCLTCGDYMCCTGQKTTSAPDFWMVGSQWHQSQYCLWANRGGAKCWKLKFLFKFEFRQNHGCVWPGSSSQKAEEVRRCETWFFTDAQREPQHRHAGRQNTHEHRSRQHYTVVQCELYSCTAKWCFFMGLSIQHAVHSQFRNAWTLYGHRELHILRLELWNECKCSCAPWGMPASMLLQFSSPLTSAAFGTAQ